MRHYCFITGFLRSGTTLVEKMVHALPGACIGPQPFPYLYYDTKRAFLAKRGVADERYPLGHLFLEARYRPAEFDIFLRDHRLTPAMVAASFAAMQGYSGWQFPPLARYAAQVKGGRFAEVYRQLCDRLSGLLGRGNATLVGAKEVFCEEFLPHFLSAGVTAILVLRDVRDVVTSLKYGAGASYGNRRLPLLHILRQWRKSVAFALQLAGTPNFHVLRYEELVAEPRRAIDGLAQSLGCPAPSSDVLDDLRDQDGRPWRSNSSFSPAQGVSREAVGRFAHNLPASWLTVVELLCAPEMAWLSLAPVAPGLREDALFDAGQGLAGETDIVAPDQSLREELDIERERLRLVAAGSLAESEQERWCLFPRAYRELARSVR